MTVLIISWTGGGGSHILRSTTYIIKVQEQSKDWSHRRSPKRSWFTPWEMIKTHHRWPNQDSPQMIRLKLTTDDQDSPQMTKSRLTTDDQVKTHHRWPDQNSPQMIRPRLTTDYQGSRPGDKSSSQTSPQSSVSVFSCVPLDNGAGLENQQPRPR